MSPPPSTVTPWRLAESLNELRAEVNACWPDRDHGLDGTIGDASHAAGASDHNPDADGVVRAIDIDKDGIPARAVAEHLRLLGAAGDPRLEGGFIVFNGRIASGKSGWKWRRYTGKNPHTGHIHVSVSKTQSAYDKRGSWEVRKIRRPSTPAKVGVALFAIVGITVSIAVGYVAGFGIPDRAPGGGGGGGTFRSCITRYFGDQPSCSDEPGGDGTAKKTVLNGRDLGVCRRVSNEGCIER